MKKQIRKILKEEIGEFEWTNQIDPLQSFEGYFYKSDMSKFIKRDIKWWKNWIEDVEASHMFILDDIDELREMVEDLVNPTDGSNEYYILSKDVYNFLSPRKLLNGNSALLYSASKIYESYTELGEFAKENNLNILETLNIFRQWLDKREKEGKSLNKKS